MLGSLRIIFIFGVIFGTYMHYNKMTPLQLMFIVYHFYQFVQQLSWRFFLATAATTVATVIVSATRVTLG